MYFSTLRSCQLVAVRDAGSPLPNHGRTCCYKLTRWLIGTASCQEISACSYVLGFRITNSKRPRDLAADLCMVPCLCISKELVQYDQSESDSGTKMGN